MSHRIEKIESTLKRTIAEVLQRRIADPRIEGFVSITRVQVSPDLREAYVYVSIMPEPRQGHVLRGLQHAAGHIRTLVGKAMSMRTLPRFEFRLDESLKHQAGVYDALRRARDRTGPEPDQPDEPVQPAPPDQTSEPGDHPPDSTR